MNEQERARLESQLEEMLTRQFEQEFAVQIEPYENYIRVEWVEGPSVQTVARAVFNFEIEHALVTKNKDYEYFSTNGYDLHRNYAKDTLTELAEVVTALLKYKGVMHDNDVAKARKVIARVKADG
jgi:hypothetical protein